MIINKIYTRKKGTRIYADANFLSWKRDSNPRPTDYESVALPTALFQRIPNNKDYYTDLYLILQELNCYISQILTNYFPPSFAIDCLI